MNSSGFYRDFEDRHRGSSELIRSRLCVYRPFVEPLRFIYEKSSAIDLGCGRGEWLGLLQEWGFDAQGVDLDDDMLSACRTRGLKVQTGDAIAFLKSLPSASQVIVSGFHLAEHISFAQLQKLINQALRVLKPGGLLILETPNPENVVVGTTNFYLDPTHKRPIPPLLLAFLPEYYGYDRVKILRLQEAPDLVVQENVSLIDVFAGVSPDYAVVAQKKGEPEILDAFCGAFDKAHGLELRDLANRYDSALDRRLAELSQRIGNAESQAGGMSDALARIADLQDRLVDAVLQAERNAACAQIAENTVSAAENRAREQEQRALVAENRAYEQEQRTLAAENRAHEQEQRALAAENRAHEQEQRALAAENRAHEQEQRALAAENRAHEQEQRALAAENHAHELEQCVLAAENHAHELEQCVLAAENRTHELGQCALAAENHAHELEQRALAAESRAHEQEQRALVAENLVQGLEHKNHELGGNCHHWWLSASALESERNALRQSWSWRITAPVRWAGGLAISIAAPLQRGSIRLARISIANLHRPVAMLMRPILRRPELSYQINQRLMRYPALHQQLIGIARQSGIFPHAPSYPVDGPPDSPPADSPDFIHLTPHARRIYADLKAAIEKNREVH